jgi:hypothetical protein
VQAPARDFQVPNHSRAARARARMAIAMPTISAVLSGMMQVSDGRRAPAVKWRGIRAPGCGSWTEVQVSDLGGINGLRHA